jgi:predicted phosphoadenosine phosphosulfate sulfurtransferase
VKIYLAQNVFEAALDRIRWLFDEFPNVVVNISGGKDSTVVLNLALQVAEEKGRLPLNVMFIDQEAEWQTVIDHIRVVMADSRIKPYWLQVPIKIFNATSTIEPWLYCWEEGKTWIREKESNSIHVNRYGTDRFVDMFEACGSVEFSGKTCRLAGVRTEESPGRMMGLTSYETYGGETWGTVENKKLGHFTFYPIYDWSYTDVWKAILDHNWPYCRIYDFMYQYGVPVRNMRVSNVHHETAVRTLFYLQEIEGETWSKITARIGGLSSAGHLQNGFFMPSELPFMFKDWWEYRDYLLDNLLPEGNERESLRRQIRNNDALYDDSAQLDLVKTEIQIILVNDYHGTKFSTFAAAHGMQLKNYGARRRA